MGRRILAQAGAISAVATQIMRGDLSQRLPVRNADDEINTLAREINNMLDKIEQLTLGMRTVLDSAAHDLRTPLNRLQATAEKAMSGLERRVAGAAGARARHHRGRSDAQHPGRAAAHCARRNRHGGARTGRSVGTGGERGRTVRAGQRRARHRAGQAPSRRAPKVQGSRQLLAQALANLLDNAIKFTPDGGHIRVQLRGSANEPEVIVEDDGPGIPADKRELVLGRRVRLDEARKFPGSGLGLSLVAAVTKLHGARLVLDDAGPGLRVSLKF